MPGPTPPGTEDPERWLLAGSVALAGEPAAGIVVTGSQVSRAIRPGERPPPNAQVLDFRPHLLAPGTLDVHTHGAVGHSFSAGADEDTEAICRYRATTGATGLLATITGEWGELLVALDRLGRQTGRIKDGAQLLGVHVEGPFINPVRKGAISEATMRPPAIGDLRRLQHAAHGAIRMMTVAPELPGALPVIEEMVRLGIVPSIGHSDAGFEQVREAASAGVRKSTHTYNAMRPLHHRDPGTVGGVLAEPRIVAEIIADGIHVHAGAIGVALKAKGAEGVALVTDGVRYAGWEDGVYERAGRGRITVRDGAAVLDDGTIAGSVSPMNRNLRLMREWFGTGDGELFTMAAGVPATLLGEAGKGHLRPGAEADFAVYDAEMRCLATFIGGRQVFAR